MGESISFWEPQCFWDSGIPTHMRQLAPANKKRAQKRLSLYRFALGARCSINPLLGTIPKTLNPIYLSQHI